ncbi:MULTISPECIES: DUF349 domain-containing protein [Halomonadaceae]|uniref:DUF349 domain-containing protein n=1 Tax=Halomonadaceae TaxID=28256 RepID=UPI00159B093D|nr:MULTISPECIES: DUF349 domain-containing protein [Halomonas]QJQ94622.1 DUF349 domain-containing protein [Halomonas sp. PA5]
MSGWFRQLFSPSWQHPDPKRRRLACEGLDASSTDDRVILERLAIDSDAGVRQSALARLNDPDRLLELKGNEQDSPELLGRLTALLIGADGGLPLDRRLECVERLADAALLAEVALHGDNQQLRLVALASICDDEEETLILQACENGIAAVRHAAAGRIASEEGLARLVRQARRDKQVVRLAREKLNRLRADASQSAARRAERERILQTLERHAQHTWEPLYGGHYRHLKRKWEGLGDVPSPEQEQRYQEACLLCRKTLADHEAQQHVHEAADRRREDADQTRESLLEAFEEAITGLREDKRLAAQDIDSLRSQKQLLTNRWQTLSDKHPPDEALSLRYDTTLEAYDYIGHAWERFRAQSTAMEEALGEHDVARLRERLHACAWPDDLPLPSLLAKATAALTLDAALPAEVHREPFLQELQQVQSLLERGAFKSASRLHQRLRQRSELLAEQDRQELLPILKRLGAQLAELRDWRGFVAGPKRTQLCQAITELADDTMLAEPEIDRRHRQLVREWKVLGDAAVNRELAAHFRSASDRIHARLAPWQAQRDAQRQRNLEARKALCEQLEALLNQPDPAANPDVLREIRDKSREQWQRYSPVPRKQSDSIGRRFGRVRHGLQALIDRRAQEIATAKRELIEQAAALLESEAPSHQRAERAKALQQRWRDLGRAPKGEEQALWREFRALCDRIFAGREAERNDRVQRAKAQLDVMQALIDRLDSWHPTRREDAAQLDQALAEAEQLEPLPAGRRTEGMRKRWQGIVRARREQLARVDISEEVARWKALQPLLGAHLSADAATLEGAPAEPVAAGEALDGDMVRAHQRRNAIRQHPPEPLEVEEALARLRVHLALLAGARVSQRDDPLRLAIQVERLNEGLGRERSKAEELHEVLYGILATGPVSASLWEREAPELDAALAHLLRLSVYSSAPTTSQTERQKNARS